ncbi:MAG: glycosyltransferase 87 family protein [Nitrospinales bacterium]
MDIIPKKYDAKRLLKLRTWWAGHYTIVLRLSTGFMGIISILRWKYELHRLLFETGRKGAIDLKLLYFWVNQWSAGNPVYEELSTVAASTYPPASHIILWPFLGWLNFTSALWLWAFTMMGALTWLIIIVVRESLAETFLERLFLVLLILSMYSTCITIGNGQLGIHILPPLLWGLLMIQRSQKTWLMDLIISLMILFCLVKPSITVPFFWILLCKRKGLRPAVMIVFMYIFLTFFAVSFQETGFFVLMKEWLLTAKHAALNAKYGYANLHQWMSGIGFGDWIPHASLSVLILLGLWLYYHRNKDIWLLMGVTAIISRIWTYHALYDDILILIPMVALFRIAKQGASRGGEDMKAGILLVISWFSMLSPGRFLTFPPPWNLLFKIGQPVVWFAILFFLLIQISRVPQRNYPL